MVNVNPKLISPVNPETSLELEIMIKPFHELFCFNPIRLFFSDRKAVREIINDLLFRELIRPAWHSIAALWY